MHLLRREYEIIRMLSLNPEQVFRRSCIYETIWGLETGGDDMEALASICENLCSNAL